MLKLVGRGTLLGRASKNVRKRGVKPFTKQFGKAIKAEIKLLQKGKKRKTKSRHR